ncbi:site-specific integrase [Puniceibacterium sediminis]|nr:site-specific integrase [Puniceibacterium sediminis]
MFYFRKRLPATGSNHGSKLFLCLSLRTDLPFDAVKRTAALLTVYEREEKNIVDALNAGTLCQEQAKALLTEMLRAELARILAEQSTPAWGDDAQVEPRIAALEAENKTLRRASRRQDWSSVQGLLAQASAVVGLHLSEPLSPELGRQATSLKKRLNDVEMDVLDGDDVRSASRTLCAEEGIEDFDVFVREPVLLSRVWDQTLKNHPADSMKGNIAAIAKLALEYFGDIPATALTKERQKEFFAWMSRLPKGTGKAHGKNRYRSVGRKISKEFEISEADARDLVIMDEIRKRDDLSLAEKRARLEECLVPRLTMTTIKRNRDGLNRMMKAAADLGAPVIPVLSYRELERHVQAQAPEDELYVRVTKPKTRMPWSEERLAKFLTSPVYTGSASEHRRWQRGNVIVRDATYWVPLIVLTMGSRIEEILLLKRRDVLLRNSVLSFSINSGCAQTGKTEDSKRIVPVPQILLDLGFREWWQHLTEAHGILLFPEAARRSTTGDVTSAFGKHFSRILVHLGLGDFDEDFYAMRKTLSSMLHSAKVSDGQRQAIAGHRHGSILNVHYTAHHSKDLKVAIDRADFQLTIGHSSRHGFPVIRKCSLGGLRSFAVEVTLNDASEAQEIIVTDDISTQPVFEFQRAATATAADIRKAASGLAKVVSESNLVLPKSAAFEHFHAMGS